MATDFYYDIVIIGAGMVGASLAASLKDEKINILLIDKILPTAADFATPEPQARVSAINLGAIRWLKQQGVWQQLNATRIQEYNQLKGFEGSGASLLFKASDINETKLGAFIENNHLQLAALKACTCDIELSQQIQIVKQDDNWQLTLDNKTVITPFVIGADGSRSQVANQLNFTSTRWQYRQACLSITVKMAAQAHSEQFNQTWQEFRPEGPIAFLPLYDHFANLIIYDTPEQIAHYKTLSHTQLKTVITPLFTHLNADFTIIQAASFPLTRKTIHTPAKSGALLVGDAAHSIHPLAGQGVNLGIRDIAAASQFIKSCIANNHTLTAENTWDQYLKDRQQDVWLTSTSMDLTYKLFSNNNPLLKTVRRLTLNNINKITPIKQTALKYALGLNNTCV
ncbi:FAD-dependent monooxygenase [Algibacillus agarilyticus]|uniref:FAD-dependent monooxygenase n=1 Tax=Algibacillus agarilyticus TaxID=2234133 RepID=UPI000DCFEFD9|nr:FAD-dependent monooxygenase [Algibacillus agarilyticus]